MSLFSDFWARIKAAIEGEATTIEATFTELEAKLLPAFGDLLKQIEKTLGKQGIAILEDGLPAIATVILDGGNVGLAISELVPKVISEVQSDLKQDATNAAHGALSLLIATIAPVTDAAKA
jgi:hypothetical protein